MTLSMPKISLPSKHGYKLLALARYALLNERVENTATTTETFNRTLESCPAKNLKRCSTFTVLKMKSDMASN